MALSRPRRSPMVHMKAPIVLFNFSYPNIWIDVFRYENTAFTRQNLAGTLGSRHGRRTPRRTRGPTLAARSPTTRAARSVSWVSSTIRTSRDARDEWHAQYAALTTRPTPKAKSFLTHLPTRLLNTQQYAACLLNTQPYAAFVKTCRFFYLTATSNVLQRQGV